MEHLQAILKEFDPTGTSNKTTLIRYFREGLRLSIQAQLDHSRRDLDMWEEVVEKENDIEVKANLQLSFYIREIDSKCLKDHFSSAKKDKEDTHRKFCDKAFNKNKDKTKFHNSSSANQP